MKSIKNRGLKKGKARLVVSESLLEHRRDEAKRIRYEVKDIPDGVIGVLGSPFVTWDDVNGI